jgi:hypothetical protein
MLTSLPFPPAEINTPVLKILLPGTSAQGRVLRQRLSVG